MKKLKTLNDLSSVTQTITDHTKRKVIDIDENEDLVFDKPAEVRKENLPFVSHEDLRKEAIRWLAYLDKNPEEWHCEDVAPNVCSSLKRWIQYFFDLQ